MATKDPENLFNFILYRFRMNLTTFESWSTTSRPTTTLPTTSRPTTSRPTTTTRRTTPRPTTLRLTTTRLHWHPRLARHVRWRFVCIVLSPLQVYFVRLMIENEASLPTFQVSKTQIDFPSWGGTVSSLKHSLAFLPIVTKSFGIFVTSFNGCKFMHHPDSLKF